MKRSCIIGAIDISPYVLKIERSHPLGDYNVKLSPDTPAEVLGAIQDSESFVPPVFLESDGLSMLLPASKAYLGVYEIDIIRVGTFQSNIRGLNTAIQQFGITVAQVMNDALTPFMEAMRDIFDAEEDDI
jgi:hypothetical protein